MTSTANTIYNLVAPAPSVFCTPSGSAIVPVCRKLDYETHELDGWRLSGEPSPSVSPEMTGGLISLIARASEIGVFQERALTTIEQSTIENFTMTHQQTGERRGRPRMVAPLVRVRQDTDDEHVEYAAPLSRTQFLCHRGAGSW